jgi:hypothetical protein
MFMSPITSAQIRKSGDRNDILSGNMFLRNDLQIPNEGYISLL